jgi:UDP-N-acetyl-D-mannosaminuronic acid transferase (WecB/TagA/CpsF family)/ADP-ribose pyrophosphatase YjhB (NUDIX family)
MSLPYLFGVKLPQISKINLKTEIRDLKQNSKTSLYFLYSEFLLRANRNPAYKEVLNNASISAIDGKGLHFSMWRVMGAGFLPKLYSKYIINWPLLLRMPVFLVFFGIELLVNLVLGFITLLLKINFTARTRNQTILGRDFVYDLIKIAEERGWKTLILGGNSASDEVTKNLVHQLFPSLNLITWTRSSTSLLMKDIQPKIPKRPYSNLADRILSILSNNQTVLTSNNVCQVFPDLYEAKLFIKQEKPDLILTCLGGASGKQEFFIDNLCNDKEIEFTLATGIGAAVDHLGGGAKQTEAPKWMQNIGLEWLFRFYNQPYRRFRIIDSILTLWFWTTLQEFMLKGQTRTTVHAAVHRSDNLSSNVKINNSSPFLLVERYNILPGDTGWSMVQGEVEKNEDIGQAALREVCEETNLNKKDLILVDSPVQVGLEFSTISFIRYFLWGAKFNSTTNYVQLIEYVGNNLHPKTNWENQRAKWWPVSDLTSVLSTEKRVIWEKFMWQKKG